MKTATSARAKMISFRLPVEPDKYLRQCAKSMGGITKAVLESVRLHQEVSTLLSRHKPALQQLALDSGLDWDTQRPELYAKIIGEWLKKPHALRP